MGDLEKAETFINDLHIVEFAHHMYCMRFEGYIKLGQVEIDDVYMPADTHI